MICAQMSGNIAKNALVVRSRFPLLDISSLTAMPIRKDAVKKSHRIMMISMLLLKPTSQLGIASRT